MRRRSSSPFAPAAAAGSRSGSDVDDADLEAAAAAVEVNISKEEALLEYRAQVQRLTGGTIGSNSNASAPAQYHLLNSWRGGATGNGLQAAATPSRKAIISTFGARMVPNYAVEGSVDNFASSLFSAVFNKDGSMLSVACQDASISIFDVDQLLYHAARHPHDPATSAAAGSSPSGASPYSSSRSTVSTSGEEKVVKPKKLLHCHDVGWSLIGCTFSPDGRW